MTEGSVEVAGEFGRAAEEAEWAGLAVMIGLGPVVMVSRRILSTESIAEGWDTETG